MILALEMQSVAVGWQVYDITKKPLDLGLIGLAQFTPSFLLFLLTGQVTDRFDRKKLLFLCYLGFATCSGLLLAISFHPSRAVLPIYGVIILSGVVRAFNGPVTRSILPQLIPEEHFANAVAWSSSANQSANILGPSIGGFVYAISQGPYAVYGLAMIAGLFAALSTLRIHLESKPRAREPVTLKVVFAGIHYIWEHKVVLGSISLDLFAVLLGGAVALLPVYAREILHTGPWGTWPSSRLSRNRGGPHGALARTSTASWQVWRYHAMVRRWFRRRHHSFRNLTQHRSLDARSGHGRCHRYGQRHDSRHPRANGNARRNARPRQRSRHDLHRRVQRTRSV